MVEYTGSRGRTSSTSLSLSIFSLNSSIAWSLAKSRSVFHSFLASLASAEGSALLGNVWRRKVADGETGLEDRGAFPRCGRVGVVGVRLVSGESTSFLNTGDDNWLPKRDETGDVWWNSGGTRCAPREVKISSSASIRLARASSHSCRLCKCMRVFRQWKRCTRI